MVFASAIGPGFAGAVIDLGFPFPQQAVWYAGYTVIISLIFLWIAVHHAPRPVAESFLKTVSAPVRNQSNFRLCWRFEHRV
jgi:hypothetical protein